MKRSFWISGQPHIWLTGGSLAFCLLLVAGLVLLILVNGLGVFWPAALVQFTMRDGQVVLGQVKDREPTAQAGATGFRIKVKRANRDIDTSDFIWIEEADIAQHEEPQDALTVERREWGDFFGHIKTVKEGEHIIADGAAEGLAAVNERLPRIRKLLAQIEAIEKKDIGDINYAQERLRVRGKQLDRQGIKSSPEIDRIASETAELQRRYDAQTARIEVLKQQLQASVILGAADGAEKEIPLANIVRCYQPNQMGLAAKIGLYAKKAMEFVV